MPVQELRIIHRRDTGNKSITLELFDNRLSFFLSFVRLATNLQTAYIEFNTVQEAEQWMNLTQVQTKLSKTSIILVSIDWWDLSSLIYNRRQSKIDIILLDKTWFGHSTQSWLLIFIQGTFLLNDHPVTLKQRFDDDSSSTNTNTQRDYSRNNNINELRLRDWDCYKVKQKEEKKTTNRTHIFLS